MNQLTLEWSEAGETKTQTISDSQAVRIGRDPAQCNIVFPDRYAEKGVSNLHIEIFFKPELNRFCLRNLRHTNPPTINNVILLEGTVVLTQGSTIYLGEVKLTAVEISQTARLTTTILPNLPVNATETSPSSQKPSNTKPVSTPPPSKNLTHGLECHNCGLQLSGENRNGNCPRCGHFLDVAQSIIQII